MKGMNKNVLFLAGAGTLIVGVSMILAWWPDVVSFFKGFLGIVFAVAGLMLMHVKKT